ncbi:MULTISPECIES: hypothetical protein [Bacillus cereus group]|uniref:hypothetical protein n=1 Tax=Bacillus cereus group TaxID=86661 RepID=UPI0005CE14CD|nr:MULTISPECIES: hypothetical protein [Bacillus cereus group]TBL05095.1 hypothetical protein EYB35_21745 [Bacillus paranthracis]
MYPLPKQPVKCFLNADLNGNLQLDSKEPQVDESDFDHLYMFSVQGIFYPVNKPNVSAYFYDENHTEYLVINKEFSSDYIWKPLDEEFFKVKQAWDTITPK